MNYSKKHKKHEEYVDVYYCETEEDTAYTKSCVYHRRNKKHRKAIKQFRKDVRSGAWQKRVYEQTGIKLSGLND